MMAHNKGAPDSSPAFAPSPSRWVFGRRKLAVYGVCTILALLFAKHVVGFGPESLGLEPYESLYDQENQPNIETDSSIVPSREDDLFDSSDAGGVTWLEGVNNALHSVAYGGGGSKGVVQSNKKRITLVVIWNDDKLGTYLPSLFSSARANADAVDLLFINVQYRKPRCLDLTPYITGATNIEAHCITMRERAVMSTEYFCSIWKCTDAQYAYVLKFFVERDDGLHVDTKPWRGNIYKRWIKTGTWAWLDPDIVIGDFAAIWPWDIVDKFDFITVVEATWQTMYLRGQLTAFKFSEKMDHVWLDYEPLSRPENVHKLPRGSPDEWEYSDLYLNKFKSLDWIMLPRAMGRDSFGKNKLVMNGKKAFYVPTDMSRRDITLLFDPAYTPKSEPLFAAVEAFDPVKNAVPIKEIKKTNGDKLYNKELSKWDCGWRDSRCIVMRQLYFHRSVAMRWGGEMLEYFDRRSAPRSYDYGWLGIEEKILIHHQGNKKAKWFQMPPQGIPQDQILEMGWPWVTMYYKSDFRTTFTAHGKDHDPEEKHDPYGLNWWGFGEKLDKYPQRYLDDLSRAVTPHDFDKD